MGRGFALFAGAAPEIIRASAREAEALGYSSFWVNHPGATDGLAALALAAKETRRIELGIGVIPLHTRGPDSIVQGVRANALPLGRLLLGVGSPNPGALRRVRDGVAALRSELPVRLVVAALGPQMCRLAGEVADAVLFNWLTPEHARRSAEWVRAGPGSGRGLFPEAPLGAPVDIGTGALAEAGEAEPLVHDVRGHEPRVGPRDDEPRAGHPRPVEHPLHERTSEAAATVRGKQIEPLDLAGAAPRRHDRVGAYHAAVVHQDTRRATSLQIRAADVGVVCDE